MWHVRWAFSLAVTISFGCADSATEPRSVLDAGSSAATSKVDAFQTTAGAQAKVYCDGTSCVAAAFEFKDYRSDLEGRYTILSAYFQNLQGTYPSNGPTTPVSLNWFFFQFFDPNVGDDWVDAALDNEALSVLGNVVAGDHNVWSNDSPAEGVNYDSFTNFSYGIVGCDGPLPEFPLAFFAFNTCPASGLDGWVRIDFKLRHLGADPSHAPVRFHDFRFSFGELGGGFCSIGGKEPGTCDEIPYNTL